jgi:pilus assembly protein CpaB
MSPPFANKLKINTNWLLLGLALALGGGAAYLGNRILQQRMQEIDETAKRNQETVAVVVAKKDLAPGDPIASENFAVRQVPREFVNADAVVPKTFAALERQRLAVVMKRGDMLLPVHADGQGAIVFSATLKTGRRALTFEVDTVNAISGMLRPGDRIDLMYTAKDSGQQAQDITRTLLSNVIVLATDQSMARRDEQTGKDRSFGTVTLDLSPADAQRIIVAKQSGKLTALLRHPDDPAANPTVALTAAGLFQGVAARSGLQIEYIVGGGGGPADIQRQSHSSSLPAPGGPGGPLAGLSNLTGLSGLGQLSGLAASLPKSPGRSP